MNRRSFIAATSSAALFHAPLMALDAGNPFRKEIGIQLYTLRNEIKKDTSATIKAVVDAGYKQGEMYGFPNCQPMIDAAKDHGLDLHSAHFDWESVTNPEKDGVKPFAEILEKAKDIGLSHLVIPYLHGHERGGADAYKRLCERCNKGAELAKTAGIQLAYHNHAFEFAPLGDTTGYDIMIQEFSPDMHFEMDVFWIVVGGRDPKALIEQLKGRVSQLHLKDLKAGMELPNFGKVPKDAFQELGDGIIDMEPLMEVAVGAGVKHCHVEQDQSPNPLASIEQSMAYLKAL